MRKNRFTAIAAVLMAFMMLFCACGAEEGPTAEDYQQQIAALQQENEQLKNEIQVLTRQLETFQSAVLTDWSLKAKALADRSAATVTFTAVPAAQQEGQQVSLIVELNGLVAEMVQCAPDENRFYATVELPAADGYAYYCLITGSGGTQQQIPLITPTNGGDSTLINLATSLNAYCNLFVEDWDYSGKTITLHSGFAQAQMPIISTGGDGIIAQQADLVFLHNGEEVSRFQLFLTEGEAEGSYEAALSGQAFEVPQLEDDHQLDLALEITLSDGSTITSTGCSWFYSDGKLNPVMG